MKRAAARVSMEPHVDHNYAKKKKITPYDHKGFTPREGMNDELIVDQQKKECMGNDAEPLLSPKCEEPDPLELPQCRLCGELVDSELKLDTPCAPPHDAVTYRKLIDQCFSLNMSTLVKCSSVCKSCVERLMEAWQFRNEVADTERKLLAKVTDSGINIDNDMDGMAKDSADVKESDILKMEPDQPDENVIEVNYKKTKTPENKNNNLGPKSIKSVKMRLSMQRVHSTVQHYCQIKNACAIIRNSYVLPFRRTSTQFLCAFCEQTFDLVIELRQHTTTEHDVTIAEFMYTLKNKRAHIKVEITEINCRLCSKNITDLDTLVEHLQNEHGKKFNKSVGYGVMPFHLSGNSIACVICCEQFKTYVQVSEHMNVHFLKYKGEDGGKGFASKNQLWPRRVGNKTTSNLSQSNDKMFANVRAAIENKYINKSHSTVKCFKCMEKFHTVMDGRLHLKNVHGIEPKRCISPKLKCGKCAEMFHTLIDRRLHLQSVHGIEPENRICPKVKCGNCTEMFHSPIDRRLHLKSAHGIEPEKRICPICGYIALGRKTYSRHVRVHHTKDSELLLCKLCNKTFVDKDLFRKHELTHSKEDFECYLCDKKYVHRLSLTKHMEVHKTCPYACSLCGQPLGTKRKLMKHMQMKHPGQLAPAVGADPSGDGKVQLSPLSERCQPVDEHQPPTEQCEAVRSLLQYN